MIALLLLSAGVVFGQITWTGAVDNNWSTAGNWSPAVVPTSSDAVIINSGTPNVDVNSVCLSLTINGGTLTFSRNRSLTVGGNVTINSGGTIHFNSNSSKLFVNGNITNNAGGTINQQRKSTITLTGNWTNSGSYSGGSQNSTVTFNGTIQSISGATTFRKFIVNASSRTTLLVNITVSKATINGIIDPGQSPTYKMTASGGGSSITVGAGGTILVKGSLFSDNYAGTLNLNPGSIVEYASSGNQTVATLSYSTLRISGGGVKTAAGNLTINGTTATTGNIEVLAGTLDLSSFTANRIVTVAGGTLTVANGATLRFQTSTFPTGYDAHILGGTSTIDYAGAAQTVLLEPQNASSTTYGNLRLSGSGTKTMPASYMYIRGNFTMTGTVTAAAGGALRIDGNDSVGTSCFFSTAFDDTIGGNFINNGSFISTAHTVLTGPSAVINGSGGNHFNDLTITGVGVTAATNTNILVAGNFATSGAGTYTHTGGGTGKDSLTGTGKTISGDGIEFNNLIITGTITTSTTFGVLGDMKVPSGSFTNTGGDVDLEGNGYVLTGGGTITFYQLDVHGHYTTTATFTIKQDFAVTGSFSASSGLVTFDSATVFSGTANLYDVTVSSGKRLQLGGNAVLGVKNNFTISGAILDVTTTIPNTVDYNGSGAQTVRATTYHHLNLSTGGTKTAEGNLTVNGDVTIGPGATFGASSFTHLVYGNWVNNGTLSAGTSTIRFVGGVNTTISGTGGGSFNVMALNKNLTTNVITANGNFSVATLHMTSGNINIPDTSNAVTITTARDSNGVIIGKIKWKPSSPFAVGTEYAFESPNNFVKFQPGGTRPDSITLIVVLEGPSDFVPEATTITRTYFITPYGGSNYPVNLRLHYEDDELNGNDEPLMNVHRSVTSGVWVDSGKTSYNSDDNWVEDSITTNIFGRWTLQSKISRIIAWKGGTSSAWENSANWVWVAGTTVSNDPPDDTTFVTLGDSTFTYHPVINSAARVRTIKFGDTADVNLTIASGSLTVVGSTGNLIGVFDRNRTHTVDVGNQSLTIGGNLITSDGINDHRINITAENGTISIGSSITHSANSSISFSGAGTLSVQRNWIRTGTASFSAGSGTVIYNGSGSQVVAGGITYNNLTIKKSAGIATLASYATVNGDLTTDTLGTTGGTFSLGDSLRVVGNVNIKTGSTLRGGVRKLYVGGNWIRTGTFIADSVSVIFNGSGAQSIDSSTFNHITIDKSGGTATPTGNLALNGNLTISNGTFDLSTYSCDRNGLGGTMSMSAGTYLKIGNGSHHPNNFAVYALNTTSTTEYYGGGAQSIMGLSYGNLTLSNGGVNSKTLSGATTVKGDFLINSGVTLNCGANILTLNGNWTNNGTFNAGTGTVVFAGSSKSFSSGSITFNNVTVTGSYTATNSPTTVVNGVAIISLTGTYTSNSSIMTFRDDFTNKGTFTNSGTITFTGDSSQTIDLNSGFTSLTGGTVNFNGTVAPTLPIGTSPTFYNLNLNNTGDITPNVGWTVNGAFTSSSGAKFIGGSNTHTFKGNFTNGDTVTSSGTIVFNPSSSVTIALGTFASTGTVNFAGTGAISVSGTNPSFGTVSVTNTNTSGVTASSTWTVNGNFNVGSGAKFFGGTSTVVMTNSVGANISNSGTLRFYNLTISGNIIASNDFEIEHDWTSNDTLDATGATVSFVGSVASLINGSLNPTIVDQLSIDKDNASATVTLSGVGLDSLSDLSINTGILNAASFTISEAFNPTTGDSGAMSIGALGTLQIGGTNTLPLFSLGYTFDDSSTVEYNGSAQTISRTPVYGNLKLSGTSTKSISAGALTLTGSFLMAGSASFTAPGAMTIARHVTLDESASFNAGTFSHTVGGNWTNNATFTSGTSTFTFNGTSLQKTYGNTTFYKLKLNNAAGDSLLGNITVSDTLHLQNGTLAIGENDTLRLNGAVIKETSGALAGGPTAVVYYNQQSNGQNVLATNYGTLVFSNFNKNLPAGTIGISGTFSPGTATGHTVPATDTISFNGSGTQTIPAFRYQNLKSNSTGARILSPTDTIKIAGAFIKGTNTYTVTGSTVEYNGSGNQNIAAINYNNLVLSTSGTKFFPSDTTGIAGNVMVTGSAVGDALTNSSTINYNGSGNQSIGRLQYFNLILSNAGTKTFPSDTSRIAGSFSIAGSAVADALTNSSTIEYNGTGTQLIAPIDYFRLLLSTGGIKRFSTGSTGIATNLTVTGGTVDATTNSSTINYNGTAAQTINSSFTYHHLKISNTVGGVTHASGTLQVNGNLINAGKLTNNGIINTGQ